MQTNITLTIDCCQPSQLLNPLVVNTTHPKPSTFGVGTQPSPVSQALTTESDSYQKNLQQAVHMLDKLLRANFDGIVPTQLILQEYFLSFSLHLLQSLCQLNQTLHRQLLFVFLRYFQFSFLKVIPLSSL